MQNFVTQNLEHILAVMIFFARLGDIGTTFLATPKLQLESNPLLRRFRWPMAFLSFGLCALPYFSIQAAIAIIVMSLLVAFSNSSRLWTIRAMGEDAYYAMILQATKQAKPKESLLLLLLPGLFMILLATLVVLLYSDPERHYGYYVGLGIYMYAAVLLIYHPKNFLRLRGQEHPAEDSPIAVSADCQQQKKPVD